MQRRLSLASTLIHQPDLLFLDEPTGGIDPVLRRRIWDYFEELRRQGIRLFVTTQYVGEAAYCDLVGVMAQGRLLVVDTPEGLRRRAFRGDIINMRTIHPFPYQHRQEIRDMSFVLAPVIQPNELEVRIVVDEANTAIPRMMDWTRSKNIELGSFLIRLLFGIGYSNEARALRAVFVIPGGQESVAAQVQEYATSLGPQLEYQGAVSNEGQALSQLTRGQVDGVVIVSDQIEQKTRNNEQPVVQLYHREIDPFQVSLFNMWLSYMWMK